MFAISTNKALLRFSGILKSSPLKDTMSDHRNTQGYLSKEQQMLWEMDRRFGVSRCRGGLDGLDWGMMKSGQPLSATPLTARVEGKCESHLWPLWMGASANTAERVCPLFLLAMVEIRHRHFSFHFLRQRVFSPSIDIHTHSLAKFRHSFSPVFVCHHSKLQLHGSTMDLVLFSLWGCIVSSFVMLEGVCWNCRA